MLAAMLYVIIYKFGIKNSIREDIRLYKQNCININIRK